MTYGHGDDIQDFDNIRINFSSNVYNGFSHGALFSYLSRRMGSVLNYPEPEPRRLERRLAEWVGLDPTQVMATCGATEAIYLVAQAFGPCHSVVVEPTFAEYADACRLFGHRVTSVQDIGEQSFDADLCWLCNPNNPTGRVVDRQRLTHHIQSHPRTLFIIDASYAPFTDLPLLSPEVSATMPNVLLLHSLTKRFSVPGLRVGYATADGELLQRMRRCRRPWAMDSMALEAAHYLLDHADQYPIPLADLLSERKRVAHALEELGGIEVSPSDTHILLCRLHQGTAAELKDHLARRHGVLIRDASNFPGLTDRHFRIAVQTRAENDTLIAKLTDYVH